MYSQKGLEQGHFRVSLFSLLKIEWINSKLRFQQEDDTLT